MWNRDEPAPEIVEIPSLSLSVTRSIRIVVVAATEYESAPFATKLGQGSINQSRINAYKHRGREVDMVVSGVGMVATAARCSQILTQNSYDLAINLGICGSFDPTIKLGQVVHVISDRIAELGAEDGDEFLTLHDLKLLDENEFPFQRGRLVNPCPPAGATLSALPAVEGITVNTVHGNERSIADVMRRFHPQIESMEGAAFMYACLIHRVPFAQIRAVSNLVEKRNHNAWNLTDAIRNLSAVVLKIVEEV